MEKLHISNERKQEAYRIMYRNPEKIIVEYECEHEGPKQRHHYDYDKPFNIHLLCLSCHGATRKSSPEGPFKNSTARIPISTWKQLRRLEEAGTINSIHNAILIGLELLIKNNGDVATKKSNHKE